MVEQQEALAARVDEEAREMAQGLIQDYIGPDHKVLNLESFLSAFVQALKEAREQGQVDRSGEIVGQIGGL